MKDSSVKPVAEIKDEANTKPVRLAAFDHDAQLSVEAAEQLLQMASDPNVRAHKGKELATISEAELLAKLS
jgi:hypothetical protein